MECLYHLLQDELSKGVDGSEESAERLLLGVKTVIKLLSFNLNLPNGVHLKPKRLICHDWIFCKHIMKVFLGRCLGLESVFEHGLAELLLILSLQVNDLVFDILWHFIRHLLDSLTNFNATILHNSW